MAALGTWWRTRGWVHGTAALVLAVVVSLAAVALWQTRAGIFKDARNRSATLAFLLAEQTTRSFQAVDLTLLGLEPVLAARPLPDHDPVVERLLRQRVGDVDFIHALVVTDREGRVTQSSLPGGSEVSSLASQAVFEMLRRQPTSGMLIGRRAMDRADPSGDIPVARRLTAPDGTFAGVVVASVEPKYFRDFYRDLDLGPHASIDLFQDNGGVLLASTGDATDAIRTASPRSPPSFDLSAQLGHYRSPSSQPVQQLTSYHRAQGYPLVVAVSVDVSDLDRRWWRVAAPTLGACAAAALLIGCSALLADRRLADRRRALARAVTVQKLEALGQMTASVAHDFRNLLTVMQSTLTLVRKHGPKERLLDAADEAVARGNGLITQLLAFSRRQDLRVKVADINARLAGLDAMLRHVAGPDVTVAVELTPGLPACRTDETQFDAAVMNLVVNARQAMPDGGTVRIATRRSRRAFTRADGFVELSVEDAGCGIPPGDLKRIFEPFFTTKAETGTGLGLSQVYGFVRQIGGDVSVESEVGRGTTFTLLFPVAAPSDMVGPSAATTDSWSPPVGASAA